MSTPAIGNASFNQIPTGLSSDSEMLIQYVAAEQAKASEQVLQTFIQGVSQLRDLLQNTLQSLQAAAPLQADAEALDAQLTWSVDRGDSAATSAAQDKAQQDAQAAGTAAGKATQAANTAGFTPAADTAKLAKDAAAAAGEAGTTDSPMAALAAAQTAAQKADAAKQSAASAKTASTQALNAAKTAENQAAARLNSAKAALAAAKTDEETAAAQKGMDDAQSALASATADVAAAKLDDQAADAAVTAANAAVQAAASAQAAAALLAKPKEIALDNGNKLLIGPEPGHWTIQDSAGKELSISGDLKVSDPDDPSVAWTIGADSTFVLSDGTKISLDAQNGKANGLTITKGDQVITVSGMNDDTPTISDDARGGRAKDAATNDGHVFVQGDSGWTYQGEPIPPGAQLAQTELQNEFALETNDIAIPQELQDFLTSNGLTFQDNDHDGKLSADEWKDLSSQLHDLTSQIAQASAAALASLQQAAGTLLDLSQKLAQMLQSDTAQIKKLQDAAQEVQHLNKDLELEQLEQRDLEKRAQQLLQSMKEALAQSENATSLYSKVPQPDVSSLPSSQLQRIDQEVAQWKSNLEQEAKSSNAFDDSPRFKSETVTNRNHRWV